MGIKYKNLNIIQLKNQLKYQYLDLLCFSSLNQWDYFVNFVLYLRGLIAGFNPDDLGGLVVLHLLLHLVLVALPAVQPEVHALLNVDEAFKSNPHLVLGFDLRFLHIKLYNKLFNYNKFIFFTIKIIRTFLNFEQKI